MNDGAHHPPRPERRPIRIFHAQGRTLGALGLAHDPIRYPLIYPGHRPSGSGLLAGDCFLALRDDPELPAGRWSLDVSVLRPAAFAAPEVSLDAALRHWGRPVLADRQPVLAVGSNGSPAQVHAKLAGRADLMVPMTYARVTGIAVGFSAHVSRPGYVPAAPVLAPSATAGFMVVWLDEEQLAVVDATEPTYHRVRLPASATIAMPGLGRPSDCHLYAARHGCLLGDGRTPLPLVGQARLLSELLAGSPELAGLVGARTPEAFVARIRGVPGLRHRVRDHWRRDGRARDQAALIAGRVH